MFKNSTITCKKKAYGLACFFCITKRGVKGRFFKKREAEEEEKEVRIITLSTS